MTYPPPHEPGPYEPPHNGPYPPRPGQWPPAPGGYQQPVPGGYQQPLPGGYQQPTPGGYQEPAAPMWSPQSAPPPPRSGWSTRQSLIVLAATFIGLCCLGAAVLAAIGFHTPEYKRDHAVPSTPPPAATTPAAPRTTAAQPATTVVAWYNGGGRDLMHAMSGDADDLVTATGKTDVDGVRAACESLQKHVEAAQAYDQFPDPEGQKSWAAMLASYARSATDCVGGVDTTSADLLTKAGREMADGNTAAEKLLARIRALGGGA
jgi:hypothetical protein